MPDPLTPDPAATPACPNGPGGLHDWRPDRHAGSTCTHCDAWTAKGGR